MEGAPGWGARVQAESVTGGGKRYGRDTPGNEDRSGQGSDRDEDQDCQLDTSAYPHVPDDDRQPGTVLTSPEAVAADIVLMIAIAVLGVVAGIDLALLAG